MVKKIFKDLHKLISTNVLLKLILGIWEYFSTTSLTLYFATNLSR